MLDLHRVAPGVYETSDHQHRIIRQEWEGCGPRGGTAVLWEHARPDRYHGWVLHDSLGSTLREAKKVLARQLDAAVSERTDDGQS